MQKLSYVSAAVAALAFAGACGDSGNNNPDAGPNVDSAPTIDAPITGNCESPTASAPSIASFDSENGVAIWESILTPSLGATDTIFSLEFYDGFEASLVGTFDLSTGNSNNYATCGACLRVRTNDANDVLTEWFASGGTLTTTADPLTGNLTGTITDLAMVEVTIDREGDFTSTPVPNGSCLALGNFTLDANTVPADWTCTDAEYNDGVTCDCECGVEDPDCGADLPVDGCNAGQVCITAECADTCAVATTPTEACAAGDCVVFSPDVDVCWADATAIDAADIGDTCGADTTWCAASGGLATGLCDFLLANDLTCREVCDADSDCNAGDTCAPIFSEGTKGICATLPANDVCGDAVVLALGTAVDGTTAFATNDYEGGTNTDCTGFDQTGGDVAYRIALTAGQAVTVTVTPSAEFDPAVYMVGPGAAACNANIDCLGGADAGLGGDAETFNFTAVEAGNYFVVVDSFSLNESGTFSLVVANQ